MATIQPIVHWNPSLTLLIMQKRRAQRNANPHGRINKQGLIDLPIDVMVEVRLTPLSCVMTSYISCHQVFQYLEPVDILYLARTTKTLRAFLLDRHWSCQVWKTAFSNVHNMPPPCPEYLSEPVYAHLAFVPVCHVRSYTPHAFRIRIEGGT